MSSTAISADNNNDSTSGAVYPKETCPHLFTGALCKEIAIPEHISSRCYHGQDENGIAFQRPCNECSESRETWMCLGCCNMGCSRFYGSHSESHWMSTIGSESDHCIALSLSDLSVWCYSCNSYIKHDILVPILERAQSVKFSQPINQERLDKSINRFTTAIALPTSASDLHHHPTSAVHPEKPLRTSRAIDMLTYTSQLTELRTIDYSSATRESLLLVHTPDYIDKIMDTAKSDENGQAARDKFNESPDLFVSEKSSEAILDAAGAAVAMTNQILTPESGVHRGFCITRPPGHHAEQSTAGGFCYVNNTAVAANVAISKFGIDRILIVDWDIHHGNGNQNIFYDSNKVLHISIHKQTMTYQGEVVECSFDGQGDKLGKDQGLGFNVNIGLGEGDTSGIGLGDADFIAVFDRVVLPLAREFKPQLVIVPAGFDAGEADRHLITGGYSVTPKCFAEMTTKLLNTVPDGKMLMCLEGGYEPDGVSVCISAVLSALVKFDNPQERERFSDKNVKSSKIASTTSSASDVAIVTDDPAHKCEGDASTITSNASSLVHPSTEAIITSMQESLKPYWRCFA